MFKYLVILLQLFCIPAFAVSIHDFDAKWKSDANKEVRLKDWAGKKTYIAMAYTSCKGSCPFIVQKLRKIQKDHEKKNEAVNFLIISFDPKNDTPKVFNDYRKKISLDDTNWTFLTGSDADARRLSAILGVRYSRDRETGDIMHDNKIFLMDEKGNFKIVADF